VKLQPQPPLPPCSASSFPPNYLNSLSTSHTISATPPPSLGSFSPPPLNLWKGSSLNLPTVNYSSLFDPQTRDKFTNSVLGHLYSTGIVLVQNTPTDDESMRALTYVVSGGHPTSEASNGVNNGPLKTLYGEVWHTSVAAQSQGTSTADSAYTSDSLPLHTDMAYHSTPPGLQVFNMKLPAADGSGASIYLDGFAAAESLRKANAAAFHTLATTKFKYRSVDEEMGWHLEAVGSIIELDPFDGKTITGIRHNDLDRLAPLPPSSVRDAGEESTDEWYKELKNALALWDEILYSDGQRLVISLKKGDCTLVHNRRVMHGRESFKLSESDEARSIIGCYTANDDLESRWRVCFTSPE
jgi:alpha-ketoglutarate-dependent taurine dioxygenase